MARSPRLKSKRTARSRSQSAMSESRSAGEAHRSAVTLLALYQRLERRVREKKPQILDIAVRDDTSVKYGIAEVLGRARSSFSRCSYPRYFSPALVKGAA
jgi:hypothetical protein